MTLEIEEIPEVHLRDEQGRRACDPEHPDEMPPNKQVRLCEDCRQIIRNHPVSKGFP